MKFCAICTDVITGPLRLEPLGRNDALVNVCLDCATERPIAKQGPEVGYQPGDRTPTEVDSRAARAPCAAWISGMPMDNEPGKTWVGGEHVRAQRSGPAATAKRKRNRDRGAARDAAVMARKIGEKP